MSTRGEAVRHEKPASTRLVLVVVASGVFITVITATMINVLIPLMRAEFGASAAHVGWVVTGYALAYAIGVPLYGRVSDFFGVRRVFPVAGAFFLGAGTGPALIGALLAAREVAGSDAINPLPALDAAPFSDAFLAMVLALITALIAALGLQGGINANKQSERSKEEQAQ